MPVDSGSHASPTRFASGGWLTDQVGQSSPSTYQRHPLYPGSQSKPGACLSLLPVLGTPLAVTRVIVAYSRASVRKRKGETAVPPPARIRPEGRGLLAAI